MDNSEPTETNDTFNYTSNILFPTEPVFVVTQQASKKDTLVVISDMSLMVDNSNILKVYDVTQHTWIYDTHFSISYGDGVFAENEPVLAQLDQNENYYQLLSQSYNTMRNDSAVYGRSGYATYNRYVYYQKYFRDTNPHYDHEFDHYLLSDFTYAISHYYDNIGNIDPSLTNLTTEENQAISKTLLEDNIFTLTENYNQELEELHRHVCVDYDMTCPFWNTQCSWIDNVPQVTRHIRTMHDSKIVNKKKAVYLVNIKILEVIDFGYKIGQMYKGRIFLISITTDTTNIYISAHVTCEKAYDHTQICRVFLIAFLPQKHLVWTGIANQPCVSLARLQSEPGRCLVLPKRDFNILQQFHFKLTVELDC